MGVGGIKESKPVKKLPAWRLLVPSHPWWTALESVQRKCSSVQEHRSRVWDLGTGIVCGDIKQAAGNAELELRGGYVHLEDFIVKAITESHKVW